MTMPDSYEGKNQQRSEANPSRYLPFSQCRKLCGSVFVRIVNIEKRLRASVGLAYNSSDLFVFHFLLRVDALNSGYGCIV